MLSGSLVELTSPTRLANKTICFSILVGSSLWWNQGSVLGTTTVYNLFQYPRRIEPLVERNPLRVQGRER
jgi:hypothetical protein